MISDVCYELMREVPLVTLGSVVPLMVTYPFIYHDLSRRSITSGKLPAYFITATIIGSCVRGACLLNHIKMDTTARREDFSSLKIGFISSFLVTGLSFAYLASKDAGVSFVKIAGVITIINALVSGLLIINKII